ncbi:VQ motif-containing protein 4 [Hibiscus syriacus]|uniref:VQ motif-containing protein 4 n=1 Tax=Hibiscus syriacus TaxID=106335 RepID=A0A6A2WWN4_HIBSY|nr:VQ motif-containing protein 4-like [Hibiscus syriacus]KAE8659705.1 VQ motif-containing protein 4 [Hibiscus syriacus]
METSPRLSSNHSFLPSPKSLSPNSSTSSTSSSSNNNTGPPPPTPPSQHPRPITRPEPANPYPTTFVQADTSSFKQVVQMLTGSSEAAKLASSTKPTPSPLSEPNPKTHIPPIKSIPKNKQNSGFRLYERRSSLKNLKINPLNPAFNSNNSGFSPRKPEIISPSILDFPSLALSPVTPLISDPFDRSGAGNYPNCANNNAKLDKEAEEKAIKEKGFYLHPSPASTPRESELRLLPLFPVTSPRVSGSSTSS